jgi:hypothetical protein
MRETINRVGETQGNEFLLAPARRHAVLGAYAPPHRGFILSPSATLRVAGLDPRAKVGHPTVWTTFTRGAKSARPVLADGERVNSQPQPNTDSDRSCTFRSILEPEAPPEAKVFTVPKRARYYHCYGL